MSEVTVDDILKKYRQLKNTPSGERHSKVYGELKLLVINNQDALLNTIFSGKVAGARELHELILFGAHGGSVAKEYNSHWIPFLSRVYERINELPNEVAGGLEHYAALWGIIKI